MHFVRLFPKTSFFITFLYVMCKFEIGIWVCYFLIFPIICALNVFGVQMEVKTFFNGCYFIDACVLVWVLRDPCWLLLAKALSCIFLAIYDITPLDGHEIQMVMHLSYKINWELLWLHVGFSLLIRFSFMFYMFCNRRKRSINTSR